MPPPVPFFYGNQIGVVLEGANLRGHCVYAGGILAIVRAGRATLLRRGMARAYLLRAGKLQPLLYEHILGREPEYAASMEQTPELAIHHWVPISAVTQIDLPMTAPPMEIEVQRGDRLIFALGLELLMFTVHGWDGSTHHPTIIGRSISKTSTASQNLLASRNRVFPRKIFRNIVLQVFEHCDLRGRNSDVRQPCLGDCRDNWKIYSSIAKLIFVPAQRVQDDGYLFGNAWKAVK
jgi:hypothetical protein